MDSTTLTDGLSKTDIAALRLADDVYGVFDGVKHYLRCVKRSSYSERQANPFVDDKIVDVDVEGNIVEYGKHASVKQFEAAACFASLWNTPGIWAIVKPGDRIQLRWHRNNMNDNVRSVTGWVADDLNINVVRKNDVNGARPLRFSGARYCGPDNSARFIR